MKSAQRTDSSPFSSADGLGPLRVFVAAVIIIGIQPALRSQEDEGTRTVAQQATGLILETAESIGFFGSDQQDEKVTPAVLPSRIDLSDNFPPPGDQGSQGSCTSWAVAYGVMSYYERLETGQRNRSRLDPTNCDPRGAFSPAFIHNVLVSRRDKGLSISKACRYVQESGCAKLADLRYDAGVATTKPTLSMRTNAKQYRFKTWNRISKVNALAIKRHLYDLRPVILATELDDQFQSLGKSVWKKFKKARSDKHRYHAMVVVGYDDSKKAFKLLNSWGQNRGDKGYWYVSYDLLEEVVRGAYVTDDAINYSLDGTWRHEFQERLVDAKGTITASLSHNQSTDRVTGQLVIDIATKKRLFDEPVEVTSQVRAKVDGRIDRSQLASPIDIQQMAVEFPVQDTFSAASLSLALSLYFKDIGSFKKGDGVGIDVSRATGRAQISKNDRLVASEKLEPKLVEGLLRQIPRLVGSNSDSVTFRTVAGTKSKLRVVIRVQDLERDYTLVKVQK